MARMRGPDYGSMLRAIYEPRLQRQTAKENFKLKQDALKEQIRSNKAREDEMVLARKQRLDIQGTAAEGRTFKKSILDDTQSHEERMFGKKSAFQVLRENVGYNQQKKRDQLLQGFAGDNL